MITVLIVVRQELFRSGLFALLEGNNDIRVSGLCADWQEAGAMIAASGAPDIIFSEILPPAGGSLPGKYLGAAIIMLAADTCIPELRNAFRDGIKSFLTLSIDEQELLFAIRQVSRGKHYVSSELTAAMISFINEAPMQDGLKDTHDFSLREMDVLQMIGQGMTNAEMAEKIFLSKRTVEGLRQALLNKTGARNTPALVKFAMERCLLQPQFAYRTLD